jgi:hypothetical protein
MEVYMTTTYVVIPWDLQSVDPDISRFKQLHTLEVVANTISGPADCVLALDSGLQRVLSESEKAELDKLLTSVLTAR